ncbi:MAG: hypothetical protein SPF70_02770 [Lachnospiraceae bacterium]|nr:hypothetical protein [Lachnospiraceae bacterium]
MFQVETGYGILNGVETAEYYENGRIKSVITSEYSELKTKYGKFIPAYELSDIRKKYRPTVEFYDDGMIRSIYLQEQTEIETGIGRIKAEHITFYENGNIRRIFPLYGQINGYWTEENEYELAEEITLPVLGTELVCKPLCIHFYPDRNLHSITIWPKTTLDIDTAYGKIKTRLGVELTEEGILKSIEPAFGTQLQTQWGILFPFDTDAFMMHADHNSLVFHEDGTILSAKTIRNKIIVQKNGEVVGEFVPREEPDFFQEEIMIKKPMEIVFGQDKITLKRSKNENMSWNTKEFQIMFR